MSGIIISIASSCAGTCCTTCLCEICKCACNSIGSKLSRYIYSAHFLIIMIIALIIRDHGQELINKLPWISTQLIGQPSQIWYGQQGVNRISFSSFLYFFTLSFLTYITKKKKNINFMIQNQYWIVKFFGWIFLIVFSFLVPDQLINNYFYLSYFGSAIFLIIQNVLFIDFLYLTNEKLLDIPNNYGIYFMILSTIFCFITSILVIIYLHDNFINENCMLNNQLLIITLVLNGIYSTLTLVPQIEHASIFPSSIMFLYNLYLCYTSLISQPVESTCYQSESFLANDHSEIILYFGVLSTIASIIYSSFRIGSLSTDIPSTNHQELLPESSEISIGKASDEDIQINQINIDYNYSFFHLIFGLASMYIVTLYNGWDQKSDIIIGSGWSNVWIKIINCWILSLLYIWSLIAPIICKSRTFI